MAENQKAETTVPEQLKKGFSAGTGAKAGLKKVSTYAMHIASTTTIITLLIGAIFLIPDIKEEAKGTGNASMNVGKTGPVVTQATAKWEKTAEDGSLPVGVWSESYMIPPGYRTHYDKGNCVAYKIRQRLYGGEWLTHSCDGTYPAGNEIQFMVLRAGLKKIPFSIQQP